MAPLTASGGMEPDFKRAATPQPPSSMIRRTGPIGASVDLPPIAMLAGPSRRSPTPARRTVAHTTNSRLSNVWPGRHIGRYRIAHSGRQAIILVGRKKVAIVVTNTRCVEHSISGRRKRGLISTIFWTILTEAL
jgi:hypothetical protein